MARKTLTDRTLKSLKPARAGKRYDVADALVPGLAVRVTDKGQRTFVLVSRFPGSKHPTRRALGEYGALTLEQARDKARDWIKLIQRGTDPKHVEQQERLAAARNRENSFAAVAEDFIEREVSKRRRAKALERDIRNELIPRWGERPITEITRADVIDLLDELVERGAPYQAHSLLATTRRFFNWAIGRHKYGLDHSPCDRIHPKDAIGERQPRQRVLADIELRALWHALIRMPYPFGPMIKMLLLTGARRGEVAETSWPEFSFKKRLWTIPAERMKSGAVHVVPLVPELVALLRTLPKFARGQFLFSSTSGTRPVSGFSKMKTRLDKLMLEELRKLTGDSKRKLAPWRIHDLRRTLRTHLSALPVQDVVRELVIGHTQKGLHKVYDQHAYLEEKSRALQLWTARLLAIVESPPANLVSLALSRQ